MLKYGMDDLRASSTAICAGCPLRFRALDVPTLSGGVGHEVTSSSILAPAGTPGQERATMKFTLSWLKEHLETDADLAVIVGP